MDEEEQKVMKMIAQHLPEILERLNEPISQDVLDEADEIKRLHAIEWERVKNIPIY